MKFLNDCCTLIKAKIMNLKHGDISPDTDSRQQKEESVKRVILQKLTGYLAFCHPICPKTIANQMLAKFSPMFFYIFPAQKLTDF